MPRGKALDPVESILRSTREKLAKCLERQAKVDAEIKALRDVLARFEPPVMPPEKKK